MTDQRPEPPDAGTEREILNGFLDYQRATVAIKARGLTDAQAAELLVPSLSTVSGIIRHLADVERDWFRTVLDGQEGVPARWTADDPDGEFRVAPEDSVSDILGDYVAACAESREVSARHALESTTAGRDGRFSHRWVLTHMIEETARHLGQLDILRELLDGEVGE